MCDCHSCSGYLVLNRYMKMKVTKARDSADQSGLIGAWEENRQYLLNIAYRMLGSFSEAEDMAQEAYLRLLKADLEEIDDVRGWLVVVVTRVCLDHLRSARVRREEQVGPWLPEPIVGSKGTGADPAEVVTLDESVRMGLLIVLERLTPAERVVFVLHDVFQYPFEEIASMVKRTPAACRQLGSRARRRINAGSGPTRAHVDADEMRYVAERFIAACAGGNLDGLLEVLDPQVVGWVDLGGVDTGFPQPSSGRDQVSQRALQFFGPATRRKMVLAEVNGETGIIASRGGKPFAVLVLQLRGGRIAGIYSVADPSKLTRIGRP
jgi:RNA polymerase sigma-70 factor, ECF subfamily